MQRTKNYTIRLYFLLFFLYNLQPLTAQNKIVFSDDFNDNSRYWRIGSDFSGSYTIQQGNYVLQHTLPNAYKIYSKAIFVQKEKDFRLVCTLSQQDGEDNKGYGVVWGMKDDNNFNAVEISSNGQYIVYTIQNGQFRIISAWTPNKNINGFGEKNTIELRQVKGTMFVWLNDQQQISFPSPTFYGSHIGFILHDIGAMAVDKLYLYQDNLGQINLAKNLQFDDKGRENLGKHINSNLDEFAPRIAPDGKTLYFVRNGDPSNKFSAGRQDIWFAKRSRDLQTWETAQPFTEIVGGQTNAIISVMPDNNRLILFRGGRLFSVVRKGMQGWSDLQPITIRNDYNRGYLSSHCLGADQKTLVTCVDREEGYGGMDIYVCFLQDDGTFSEPKNLGATLNTSVDDFAPFLAADGVTLYYATQGKAGYGNIDIFVTRRLDDTWQRWSEPQNLGAMINTEECEANFTIAAAGDYAYFVSNKDSYGAKDIVRVKLPKEVQPNPVAMIYGKVYNQKTKQVIAADMNYMNLTDDKVIGSANADAAAGEYKMVVPLGKKYKILAQENGYLEAQDSVDLTNTTTYKEIQLDLYLVPLEEGANIRLNGVYFEQGEDVLLASSYPELRKLVRLMKENPTMEIRLEGHTDNVGNAYKNLVLSDQRVKAVKKYLVEQGVAEKRIFTQGFGGKKPVADNNNENARQLNRRVEFVILKK